MDLQLDWCNLSGDLVCGLGGTCNNTGNEYECTCRDGWRKRQNIDSGNPAIDKCNIKVCGRRELVCANDEGEEFDREDCACDTLEPACDSNPCENLANTECLNLADFSHECKCLDEFFKQADGKGVEELFWRTQNFGVVKFSDTTKILSQNLLFSVAWHKESTLQPTAQTVKRLTIIPNAVFQSKPTPFSQLVFLNVLLLVSEVKSVKKN